MKAELPVDVLSRGCGARASRLLGCALARTMASRTG